MADLKNNQVQSSGHGGKREGAGRPAGSPNKATAKIRDIARQYTEQAIQALVDVLANEREPAAARVSAANSLLDRGYGKPSNVLNGDEDGGPIKTVHEIHLVGVPAGKG